MISLHESIHDFFASGHLLSAHVCAHLCTQVQEELAGLLAAAADAARNVAALVQRLPVFER